MTAAALPVQRLGADRDDQSALDVWAQIQLVQAGDMAAFGPIYQRYQDVVFRFLYHRLANKPLVEDLCSETFIRALRRIDSFTWQGRDFGAFLVTIARNLVADHYKSGRCRLEVSIGDILDADREDRGPEGSPEASVVDYLTNKALLAGVQQLNPEQRECIVLRFLHGYSVAHTADLMGKNEGAVKALQHRAVGSLRRMFPETADFGLSEPVPDRVDQHAGQKRSEAASARKWAADQGIFVPKTGVVSYHLMDAYRAAVVTP